ncbi:DNA-(apurinic or apyrimidinic site) endonuclease [Wyeomyia smithii]|uniref:DNA-(apurinic or apyrimidinic site) endonuclease n=1 Tax=Wyeomyia smithii TaxID=174621 RepID=UPI002467F878|nr:DNA-(apurinic or apyrimidinic site) endonuclease [Wyeomyia smithii]
MESKPKRGRPGKKVDAEAEVNSVVSEPAKNGKKKAPAKSTKATKEVPELAEVTEQIVEEKKKPGRKAKPVVQNEVDPLETPEEPVKGRKGRKPAAAKEDSSAVEEPPVKKGRGKKAAPEDKSPEQAEVPSSPLKKGKALLENGNTSPPKAKGRGKAAKETAEPEVAVPAKRGRGKGKAEPNEQAEELEQSPPKKSKFDSPPKKTSPKKTVQETLNTELKESSTAAKASGRGRKKAISTEEKPTSPVKSPSAPAKRGRGRKAAAEGTAVKKVSKKASLKAKQTDDNDDLSPTNGVTQRRKKKEVLQHNGDDHDDDSAEPKAKKSKTEKKPAAPKINKSETDYAKLNFEVEGNKEYNFKISSWNVAGLRGWIGKGGLEYFEHEKPDILCVQETKCSEDQLPEEARHIKGYHPYWLCKPGGYAGVAIYSKKMPINVAYGLGDEEQDADGRLLTAEYEKFYLVCVYVPNAGRKLVTLPKRMRWDEKFHKYLQELDAKKPVIVCGDMNVAHEEIDLANPKTNKKNAGFTQEERDGMSKLLSLGFVDTFRQLYPEQKSAYTFWTYMGNARSKNVGWRLDYFIASERLQKKVVDNVMRSKVYGSDHCPITLFLNI